MVAAFPDAGAFSVLRIRSADSAPAWSILRIRSLEGASVWRIRKIQVPSRGALCKIRLPDGTFAWSVLRICSPDGALGGVQRLQSRVERPQNPFNGQGSRVKHPIIRGTLLPRGESVQTPVSSGWVFAKHHLTESLPIKPPRIPL